MLMSFYRIPEQVTSYTPLENQSWDTQKNKSVVPNPYKQKHHNSMLKRIHVKGW